MARYSYPRSELQVSFNYNIIGNYSNVSTKIDFHPLLRPTPPSLLSHSPRSCFYLCNIEFVWDTFCLQDQLGRDELNAHVAELSADAAGLSRTSSPVSSQGPIPNTFFHTHTHTHTPIAYSTKCHDIHIRIPTHTYTHYTHTHTHTHTHAFVYTYVEDEGGRSIHVATALNRDPLPWEGRVVVRRADSRRRRRNEVHKYARVRCAVNSFLCSAIIYNTYI